MRIVAATVLAFLATGSANSAPRVIACVSGDGPPVTVTIGARPELSRPVNCISAGFVRESLACAPNGGFQFTYTGGSHLAAAVKEWAGSADRVAAVTSNRVDRTTISFEGGFVGEAGFGARHPKWRFALDRRSRQATLTGIGHDGAETVAAVYDCGPGASR